MKNKIIFGALLLAMPIMLLAAGESGYLYDFSLIPESLEIGLEGLNLILALFGAFFAVKLAALSQGGSLEKTWNMLAMASLAFAVLEVYGTLSGLKILHIGGFGDVAETVFASLMAVTFYKTRKELLAKVLN